MRTSVTEVTGLVLNEFRFAMRAAGVVEAFRRNVVSRHDPSIRFTNSSISVLKTALGSAERLFVAQPAVRLRNLDHYRRSGRMSGYGCSFTAFGALLPGDCLQEAAALAHQFLDTLLRGKRSLLMRGDPALGVAAPMPAPPLPAQAAVTAPSTLLIEIGVEELPHADVRKTTEAIDRMLTEQLGSTGLTHGVPVIKATPRRIVATVVDVAPVEPDITRVVRGPRVSAAYAADGGPTKALHGFLRGKGAILEEVIQVMDGEHAHVAVEQHVPGRRATEIVPEIVNRLVRGLRADKNMRWNDPALSFSRPVRWLTVLLGETPIHVGVSALASGTTTRVQRTAGKPVVEVSSADGFEDLLAAHDIILDRDERRTRVIAGALNLAKEAGGIVDVDAESDLIDEIVDLAEDPRPILGSFEERFLELPSPVLTTVMRKHQRYLPRSFTSVVILAFGGH